MSAIVGIDPGLQGAICALDDSRIWIWDMPVLFDGARKRYDEHTMVAIFETIDVAHVWIERQQPLPSRRGKTAKERAANPATANDPVVLGGGNASYYRGYGYGAWLGICAALQLPYSIVAPQSWQAVMLRDVGGSDTKSRAIIAVRRLLPGVELTPTGCRKPRDGRADAALIALYGQRQLGLATAQAAPRLQSGLGQDRAKGQKRRTRRPGASDGDGQQPLDTATRAALREMTAALQ